MGAGVAGAASLAAAGLAAGRAAAPSSSVANSSPLVTVEPSSTEPNRFTLPEASAVAAALDVEPEVHGELVRCVAERGHDVGSDATVIEDAAEWTEARIRARAALIDSDKGPEGDFDD